MSLLDDSYILEKNLGKEVFNNYIKNLRLHDAPAHWQAWYDLLDQEFMQLSDENKINFLDVLRQNYPKNYLWDANAVYDTIRKKYIKIYPQPQSLNPSFEQLKECDHIIKLIGVSENKIEEHIKLKYTLSSIQTLIDYFVVKKTNILTNDSDISDIYDVLQKLDINKSDSYGYGQTRLSQLQLIAQLDPEDIIEYVLTTYCTDECKQQLKCGEFRKNYYIITNSELYIYNSEHMYIETKYEEIKNNLKELIKLSMT